MPKQPEIIWTRAEAPHHVVVLAPGAGAPATSPFLETIARRLSVRGCSVARFDFAYMRERLATGKRRPPPRAETLVDEYRHALDAVRRALPGLPIAIGGKSMGGRVASLLADELHAAGEVVALVCLSYPFHPPKQPEKLRTAHLQTLSCPALIVQGERDPFGTPIEVAGYGLSGAISLSWVAAADHDLKPARVAGLTHDAAIAGAGDAIASFLAGTPQAAR